MLLFCLNFPCEILAFSKKKVRLKKSRIHEQKIKKITITNATQNSIE